MTMFRRVTLACAAFVLIGASAVSARELVLGHTGQPSITFSGVGLQFSDKVKELSGGELTVSVMGASALGNNREGIEQIQQGMTDFWLISTGLLAPFSNTVSIFDLPYLFKSEKAALAFMDSDVAREIVAPLEEKGIKALGYFPMGWRHIHSNIAIRKPEQLKGVKIRTEPAPIRMAIFNAMGASAIPMDFGEVFTSLQQGVIDAGEQPLENIKSQGFDTIQKYITLDGHILDPMLLVMSKITWESLNEKEQRWVTEAAKFACDWGRENIFGNSKKLLEAYKAGTQNIIIELTNEEREAFRKATQPVYDEFLEKVGKDTYDKIMKIQESFPAESPQN
ncbi:DctP family TRAP transporter solute-binding subunit [Pyramidobacter sp. CG50-2]|uniref:DctP family TRAP transporter solute-binding subunit n=1 Tax=Pyramidobacter sp. CG50-2 TaxID=2382160 RepID=UPI000EA00103|nr:DctP family TRAP transporter solute-binding subunit [Pyramidobacter sp. CG50-2]RKJ77174.1 DctP family TRAP transporter solute-binding subunit [Pyramidobacter sp. CG50-2]